MIYTKKSQFKLGMDTFLLSAEQYMPNQCGITLHLTIQSVYIWAQGHSFCLKDKKIMQRKFESFLSQCK